MKKCMMGLLMLLCLLSFAMAEEAGDDYGLAVLGHPAELAELTEDFESEPYMPADLEKTVFGYDDRTTITNPSKYPYSAIAYLEIKGACGCRWTGTGFMISRNGMATAAHCLVCEVHNQWVSGITMYFGYRSSKNYSYVYNDGATYWYGANPFATGRYVSDDDYAYLKLEKKVGDQVGWFGIRTANNSHDGKMFTVAGYRNGVLKSSTGVLHIYDNKHVSYFMDMEPGNSGCPVFDSENYAIAINVCESSTNNFGRRINSDVLDQMRQQGLFD